MSYFNSFEYLGQLFLMYTDILQGFENFQA